MILHASFDAEERSTPSGGTDRVKTVHIGIRTTPDVKAIIENARHHLGVRTLTDAIEVAILTMSDDYYGLRQLDEVKCRQRTGAPMGHEL